MSALSRSAATKHPARFSMLFFFHHLPASLSMSWPYYTQTLISYDTSKVATLRWSTTFFFSNHSSAPRWNSTFLFSFSTIISLKRKKKNNNPLCFSATLLFSISVFPFSISLLWLFFFFPHCFERPPLVVLFCSPFFLCLASGSSSVFCCGFCVACGPLPCRCALSSPSSFLFEKWTTTLPILSPS